MLTDLEFYKNKTVFLTGHTGFKGAWMVQILKLAGARVIGYALPPETPSLFTLINTELTTSHYADIRDLSNLKKTVSESKPDVVIHMAAQPLVLESYQRPVDTYEINVMGTVNILESLKFAPSVRSFINVTTDKVYENKEWHWAYRENENLCGSDPYSNSKSCSELVTYSYKKSFFYDGNSPAISTARSGNVIGGGDFAKDRIIPDCIRAASEHKQIEVRNPFSIRPYQHVLDSLIGYLTLAKTQYEDKTAAGSYNFGPDESGCAATGELVEMFCKAWGHDQTWQQISNERSKESAFLKLDPSIAKMKLGHINKWNIEKAVQKTVEWTKVYLERGDIEACMNTQIKEYLKHVR